MRDFSENPGPRTVASALRYTKTMFAVPELHAPLALTHVEELRSALWLNPVRIEELDETEIDVYALDSSALDLGASAVDEASFDDESFGELWIDVSDEEIVIT
jgi:hypothetical protein